MGKDVLLWLPSSRVFLLLTALFGVLAFGAMLMQKPAKVAAGAGGH